MLSGIVAANIISLLAVPFWTQPRIVYRHVLNAPLRRYYLQYAVYAGVTMVSGAITCLICSLLPVTGALARLISYLVVCLIVPNGISLLVFRKTDAFQYLLEAVKRFLGRPARGPARQSAAHKPPQDGRRCGDPVCRAGTYRPQRRIAAGPPRPASTAA